MTFINALNQWSGAVAIFLLILVLILGGMVLSLQSRISTIHNLWTNLLGGVHAENVEHLLIQHLEGRESQQQELEQLKQRIHVLESKMRTSKRFTGLVRYDAFEGVGGEQSFAMAMYDDDGNGVVVSSQIGRSESRVFGKRLSAGRSERGLTKEEEAAIAEAAGGRSRPQISS